MNLRRAAPKKEELDSVTRGRDAGQTRTTDVSSRSQGRWLNLKIWVGKTRRGRNEPVLILESTHISANFLPNFLPTNHLSSLQACIVGQVRSRDIRRLPRSPQKSEDTMNIMPPVPSHFITSKQELSCAEYRKAEPIFCFWY